MGLQMIKGNFLSHSMGWKNTMKNWKCPSYSGDTSPDAPLHHLMTHKMSVPKIKTKNYFGDASPDIFTKYILMFEQPMDFSETRLQRFRAGF